MSSIGTLSIHSSSKFLATVDEAAKKMNVTRSEFGRRAVQVYLAIADVETSIAESAPENPSVFADLVADITNRPPQMHLGDAEPPTRVAKRYSNVAYTDYLSILIAFYDKSLDGMSRVERVKQLTAQLPWSNRTIDRCVRGTHKYAKQVMTAVPRFNEYLPAERHTVLVKLLEQSL